MLAVVPRNFHNPSSNPARKGMLSVHWRNDSDCDNDGASEKVNVVSDFSVTGDFDDKSDPPNKTPASAILLVAALRSNTGGVCVTST